MLKFITLSLQKLHQFHTLPLLSLRKAGQWQYYSKSQRHALENLLLKYQASNYQRVKFCILNKFYLLCNAYRPQKSDMGFVGGCVTY